MKPQTLNMEHLTLHCNHVVMPAAYYAAPNMAEALISISRAGVFSIASNNTPEAHESYLYQPEALLDNIRTVRYDQVNY
jgi:hypothetical protein